MKFPTKLKKWYIMVPLVLLAVHNFLFILRYDLIEDVSHQKDAFSACLLIKDDNPRLIEWLAYSYQVLPLRHLIVAVDPESNYTPLPILKRWDHTDLKYIVWNENDYMTSDEISGWAKRKAEALEEDSSITESDLAMKLRSERQSSFLSKCYKYHKLLDHSWVVNIDTDEFLMFNTINDDDIKRDKQNSVEDGGTSTINQDRKKLPKLGKKTVLDVIQANNFPTCTSVPRLLFSSIEATESELNQINRLSAGFDPKKFQTLRFLQHQSKKKIGGEASIPKVLLNLKQVPFDTLSEPIESVHRPFKDYCPSPETDMIPDLFDESLLRVNHYHVSGGGYEERDDNTSENSYFAMDPNLIEGPSYDAVTWLKSFVKKVGKKEAWSLLRDVGEIQNVRYTYDYEPAKVQSTCALLFFGMARNFNDVAFPSIKQNILDVNYLCDVFVDAYALSQDQEEWGEVTKEDLSLMTDPSKIIFKTEVKLSVWDNNENTFDAYREWQSIDDVWKLMEHYEEHLPRNYDRVGLFGLNAYYVDSVEVQNSREVAVIPALINDSTISDDINDRMFYGNRAYAKVWAAERFPSLTEYNKWQPKTLDTDIIHSKHILRFLLFFKWKLPITTKLICFQVIHSPYMIVEKGCDFHEGNKTLHDVIVLGHH